MCAKNGSDEILDLTEVVKVGEGLGVSNNSSQSENDVLNSLVNEFEEAPQKQEKPANDDDDVLDLTNLDSLISSYKLDEDIKQDTKQEEKQVTEPEENFDSILNDIKLELDNEADETDLVDLGTPVSSPITNEKELFQKQNSELEKKVKEIKKDDSLPIDFGQENKIEDDPFDIDKHYPPLDIEENVVENQIVDDNEEKGLPFDLDVPLSSLDKEISPNVVESDFDLDLDSIKESLDLEKDVNENILSDDIDALTNDIINGPQPVQEEVQEQNIDTIDFEDELEALDNENKIAPQIEKEIVKSEVNSIEVDDRINDAISEVSLEHDGADQGFVGELKEDFDEKPAMDFFEKPEDIEKNNELLQSAVALFKENKNVTESSGVLENSLETQVQNISTNIASLQQRFVNSDSKWQVTNLELNNRISVIESRLSEHEVFSQKEFLRLKETILQSNTQSENNTNKELLSRISVIETKLLKLDTSISSSQNNNTEELSARLSALEAKVLELDSASAEVQADNTEELSARLSALEAKVLELDSASAEVQADNTEELSARLSALEAKVFELDSASAEVQADNTEELSARLSALETKVLELDSASAEVQADNTEELLNKIKFVEDRLAKLDDIFSEQKMLNDELAKKIDTQIEIPNVDDLQNKIQILENQLQVSNEKIANLEMNLEKAVSMAAAKVLREEIIPLFTK